MFDYIPFPSSYKKMRSSKTFGEICQTGDCMQALQDAVMTLLDCNIEMMMMMMMMMLTTTAKKKKKNSLTSRGTVLLEA